MKYTIKLEEKLHKEGWHPSHTETLSTMRRIAREWHKDGMAIEIGLNEKDRPATLIHPRPVNAYRVLSDGEARLFQHNYTDLQVHRWTELLTVEEQYNWIINYFKTGGLVEYKTVTQAEYEQEIDHLREMLTI